MNRPRNAGEQLQNEMLAFRMLEEASPEWVAFFEQVREFLRLDARARAGNLPADNKAAHRARTELSYVVNTLADAQKDNDAPPVVFNFEAARGAAEGGGS